MNRDVMNADVMNADVMSTAVTNSARSDAAPGGPRWSILTPVFNPEPADLAACLASVDAQAVPVQHIVVDDGSTDPAVIALLNELEKSSSGPATNQPVIRRVIKPGENRGIVAATSAAAEHATGEWIVLLDHDDELAPNALSELEQAVGARPEVGLWYSDHDVIRPDGRLAEPVYKPDWSPERLRQTNYITHLVAIRRTVLDNLGGWRPGTDGAQDHDLLLRAMEAGVVVGHIPALLVHWRAATRSVARDVANKPEAFERIVPIVAEHLQRSGIDASVKPSPFAGVVYLDRARFDERVAVVVPTRGSSGTVWGLERCYVVEAVRSIIASSTHRRLEFVVVADDDTPTEVVERFAELPQTCGAEDVGPSGISVKIVKFSEPFNFSRKINVGVQASDSPLVLLLNDDTELIEPTSISVMAAHFGPGASGRGVEPVGAVGAKLLYEDGTLQHGGHVYHHEYMHACVGWRGDHPGPQRVLAVEREVAGATAAALMVTREVFDEVGGFPEDLPLHFNDVDFSVSVRETGRRILWTPHASWYHFEGKSRARGATMDEWRRAASRWPDGEPHDPYYNPNLFPKRSDWLERPGRSGAPPFYLDDDGIRRFG